jgi:hypothetical protein
MTATTQARVAPSKKRFGPGRSLLRKVAQTRGHRLNNLWYHYSPRLKRDVILRSDVEFAHFCYVEADPTVLRYELEPDPVTVAVGNETLRTQFDAFVEFRAAPPELREIKTSELSLSNAEHRQKTAQEAAAVQAGFRYVRLTKADLEPHAQLIRNWRCALSFQAACRSSFLTPMEDELLALMQEKRRCSLEELLLGTNPGLRSKYLAALFGSLQSAKVQSDIASKPLCAATQLWTAEAGHA